MKRTCINVISIGISPDKTETSILVNESNRIILITRCATISFYFRNGSSEQVIEFH
jgi:hypothetical protein